MDRFNLFIRITTKEGAEEEVFRAYEVSEIFILNMLDKLPAFYGGALLNVIVSPVEENVKEKTDGE